MIEIFPSKLEGRPIETHQAHGETIEQWLRSQTSEYRGVDEILAAGLVPPISIEINGCCIAPRSWKHVTIRHDDHVCIYPEPKGGVFDAIGDVFSSILGIISSIFVRKPSSPDAGGGQRPQGDELISANAKANQPKLSAVIPEVAGRRRRYPDYIVPIRKYYADERTEYVKMLLCFTVGRCQIDASQVKVGNTSLISLGDDADFRVYGPGENMASDDRSEYWHNSKEVGGTTSGNGLKLRTTFSVNRYPSAKSYRVAGYDVIIPSGAGSYPDGWQSGMLVRIYAPQKYSVTNTTDGSVLKGNLSEIAPYVGMPLQIRGDNAGVYEVRSFIPEGGDTGNVDGDGNAILADTDMMTLMSGGDVVDYFNDGDYEAAFGFPGFLHQIVAADSQVITVTRLDDAGNSQEDWPGFNDRTFSNGKVELDASTVDGDWAGAFAAVPEAEVSDTLEWDVMFPSGLAYVEDDGDLSNQEVKTQLQYRDIADRGAWTTVNRNYSRATLDQIGFTERIRLPYKMRAEVRMRRIGDSDGDTKVVDEIQWTRLKSRIDIKRSYDDVTCIAVTIAGGDRLSAASDNQISVVGTRVLPVRRNGQWQDAEPTRDIAPFCLHLLKSVGYTDDMLGLEEWDRLDAIWRARGDTLDAIFDDDSTVQQVLDDCLAAGMGEFTIKDGRIIPVRDAPRSLLGQSYSPQNMTAPLTREYTAPSDDDHDYVEVEYIDSSTWQTTTVNCYLTGSEMRKGKKLKLETVTDRVQAWRIGMREITRIKYQRFSYSWDTELDAMNSPYLDYVPVSDDVPGYSQSAVVEEWNRQGDSMIVRVSEPFEWPDNPVVSFREPDGSATPPIPCTQIDDFTLQCADPGFDPVTIEDNLEPTFVQFGTMQTWAYEVLVTEAAPSGLESVSVKGVGYDERIYAFDDEMPPDDA